MAGESLRTASGLLANLPDNTSGLIQAVNTRDVVVSVVDGVGYWDDADDPGLPVTIPNAGLGVGVDILSALPGPPATAFAGNYYKLDGNNHFVPSYTDQGILVPAGTQRIVESLVTLRLSKPGGGTNLFTLQGTRAGVPYIPGRTVSLTSTPETFTFSGSRLVDVSLAEALSIDFVPDDGPADLVVHEWTITLKMVLA